jgi:hypothetical protein
MKRFSTFALGVFFGAAGMFLSMNYHLVRSKEGFHLVPKLAAKFEQPYVDIRNFSLQDWQNHQALAVAIMKANKGNLMQESTLNGFREATKGILDKLTGK